jgi:hypothetical protein
MPFSLDNLRYLIEDALPRQAKTLLAKANVWQARYAGSKRHDMVVQNKAQVDRIVRAMTETECESDLDNGGPSVVGPLRFKLRH